MVITFLLCISLIINFVLIVLLAVKMKQMKQLNQIRIGYEKRCNSFRIRYTLLSRMEEAEKIAENIIGLGKAVYIYGSGIIGKKLNRILLKYPDIRVIGFIDGKEIESDKAFGEKLDKSAVIIITPVFDYDKIVTLLNPYTDPVNIISIDEVL